MDARMKYVVPFSSEELAEFVASPFYHSNITSTYCVITLLNDKELQTVFFRTIYA